MNTFDIGILQGRLSPSLDGRLQFFPKDWEKEFFIAKDIGFKSIEWLFDWPDFQKNPIFTEEGRIVIQKTMQDSGVKVSSICADYYMKHRFLGEEANKSIEVLNQLISVAR